MMNTNTKAAYGRNSFRSAATVRKPDAAVRDVADTGRRPVTAIRVSLGVLAGISAMFLLSCSQSSTMDEALINRYETSVKAMTAALDSGKLDAAQKAMADFLPVANELGKAMISVTPEQQEKIMAISDAGTQAANRVQASAYLRDFDRSIAGLEEDNKAGDTAGLAQHAPEASQLADSLSMLETSMSPEQSERYIALSARFTALSAVVAADSRIDELETALDDYRQAVTDQKSDFALEHANTVKLIAEELRGIEGLGQAQLTRISQLLARPEAKKILGK